MKIRYIRLLSALVLGASAVSSRALEPAELFEKVAPSVWGVQTEDAQGRKLASGSAVVIGPGRLVTNCHVLAKARSFVVKKDNISYGATLEFPDPERDLCQIKVANFSAPAVEIARIDQLKVGAKVYAIGNPRGLESTLSDGLISGLRRSEAGELEIVQTSTPISAGSSGGGLFDSDGRLVGVTTGGYRDAQNLNVAMPAHWIAELAERGRVAMERRNSTSVAGNPSTTVRARPAAPETPAQPGMPVDQTAGLKVGDVFEYLLLDRMTRQSQQVSYRVERIDGDKAIFNNGARSERFNGDLVELSSLIAVELDSVTPPSGWARDGVVNPGLQRFNFSRVFGGATYAYEISATALAERQITTPAGTFSAVQIELSGWTRRALTASHQRATGRYRGTVWYSPELRRVIRFSVNTASAKNEGVSTFVSDESLELIRYVRN